MNNPPLAIAMFGLAAFQTLMDNAANHPTPLLGHPMGDPMIQWEGYATRWWPVGLAKARSATFLDA
ncbi:hypothetical protein [Variovorax saccharolyticus]|uniref:hypothetical protein n=1 Tax=Variovorax saccharolyticus TaxID=3053516 RepID=UPI00257650A4|nr:hypothetical protein [Variovorax sp. J31P216]MDM0029168.1 hypothetical protein [Variovorax sp. J31P216]